MTHASEVLLHLESLIAKLGERERSRSILSPRAGGGRFPDIPSRPGVFVKVLMGVKRRLGPPSSARQWRFLDAGCGIGDKVFLASDMGFEAHGVELDESLIRAAKRRFEARQVSADSYTPPRGDRLTLYRSDITRFTYSSFDVVFFYCPFSDPVAEGRFERRVWDQVAPGGFVIACAPETKPPRTFRSIEMPEATAGFTGWKIYQRR